jgi:hypothetical protein
MNYGLEFTISFLTKFFCSSLNHLNFQDFMTLPLDRYGLDFSNPFCQRCNTIHPDHLTCEDAEKLFMEPVDTSGNNNVVDGENDDILVDEELCEEFGDNDEPGEGIDGEWDPSYINDQSNEVEVEIDDAELVIDAQQSSKERKVRQ